MAIMQPRTGDGPLQAVPHGEGVVLRLPLGGGGRLVVALSADEAASLREQFSNHRESGPVG